MSQWGQIVFNRLQPSPNPQALLTAVLAAANPKAFDLIYRSLEEDRGWERAKQDEDLIAQERVENKRAEDPARVVRHYRDGLSLTVELVHSPFLDRIATSIEDELPESIHGGFVPDSLFVTIGYHDLFEFAEHEEGLYIARPFLSLRFTRQRTPNDWPAFREKVFALPGVRDVKTELEVAAGPLEQCVFWSV